MPLLFFSRVSFILDEVDDDDGSGDHGDNEVDGENEVDDDDEVDDEIDFGDDDDGEDEGADFGESDDNADVDEKSAYLASLCA